MRLVLILVCLATPLRADPCADQFRLGLQAGRALDGWLSQTEATLYSGLGWVTRSRVIARLEERSAFTTACEEIATLRGEVAGAQSHHATATTAFGRAALICRGVNRDRAQRNVESLAESGATITELATYLDSLAPQCGR